MPGKRPPANSIISSKKRQKTVPTVEEITFDISAREDYLTGFHKRKLQRIKHAKEEASKKEREEKIKARKIVFYPALLYPRRLTTGCIVTRAEKGGSGEACSRCKLDD